MRRQNPRTRAVCSSGTILIPVMLLSLCAGCATNRGRAFDSPERGADALVAALKPLNHSELRAILGPDSDEVVSSGDEVADQNAADNFVAAYEQHHKIELDDGRATLSVGEDEWPLPIPLVKVGNSWYFDTDEGNDEILARRIGRNELATIQACRAIVDAQKEFASLNSSAAGAEPVYATKFASDPGQHNGLFWKTGEGEPESPLGPEVVAAVAEGYGGKAPSDAGPRPFHGYCYRMLSAQGPSAPGGARSFLKDGRLVGGFGAVAWPVQYGNSGIMTFLVSSRGIVYQKDLGKDTEKIASSMQAFDPDSTWNIVAEDEEEE